MCQARRGQRERWLSTRGGGGGGERGDGENPKFTLIDIRAECTRDETRDRLLSPVEQFHEITCRTSEYGSGFSDDSCRHASASPEAAASPGSSRRSRFLPWPNAEASDCTGHKRKSMISRTSMSLVEIFHDPLLFHELPRDDPTLDSREYSILLGRVIKRTFEARGWSRALRQRVTLSCVPVKSRDFASPIGDSRSSMGPAEPDSTPESQRSP